MNLLKKLMIAIGIDSVIIFLTLFWSCYTSFEMAWPSAALRLIWLPSLPAFLIFTVIAWIGLKRKYTSLPRLMFLTPYILIWGVGGLSGISYTFRGDSRFFLDANLIGVLEIILVIISWWAFIIWFKNKNDARAH